MTNYVYSSNVSSFVETGSQSNRTCTFLKTNKGNVCLQNMKRTQYNLNCVSFQSQVTHLSTEGKI